MRGNDSVNKLSVLQLYSRIIAGVLVVYGVAYYVLFGASDIAALCTLCGSVVALSPFVQKTTRSPGLALLTLLSPAIIVVIYSSIQTGGPYSPIVFWLSLVPLTGTFVSGRVGSVVLWFLAPLFCFSLVVLGSKLEIFSRFGSPIPQNLVHFLALGGVTFCSIMLSRTFQRHSENERRKLADAYQKIQEHSANLKTLSKELSTAQDQLLQIASQVSHDIQAPLMALRVLAKNQPNFSSEDHNLFTLSVDRVSKIANSIAYRNLETHHREKPTLLTIEPVLKKSVSEKRILLGDLPNRQITIAIGPIDPSLVVIASQSDLERILSNLLNNAIEAIELQGQIEVAVTADASLVSITVSDSGKGMSTQAIAAFGQRGISTKQEGSGLGLSFSAKKSRDWGGSLGIESEVGRGTRVTLRLVRG